MRLFLLISLVLLASCGGASKKAEAEASKEDAVTVGSTNVKFTTMELEVDGMTCEGCEQTVEKTVAALPGVKSVAASHVDKNAIIEFEDGKLDVAQVTKAIEGAGYEVVTKE